METEKNNPADGPFIPLPGGSVLAVLHEDADAVVVDRPDLVSARLPHAADADGTEPFERALREALAAGVGWARQRGITELHPVHTLDPGASGVWLLARSRPAQVRYRRLLETRGLRLQYLALVGGKPPRRRWVCALKLSPDPAHPHRLLTDTRRGRHAQTDFEVLGHGDGIALVLARPRTHEDQQVRVHLAASGVPILGDTWYGFGRDLPRKGRRPRLLEHTTPFARGTPGAGTGEPPPSLALRAAALMLPSLTSDDVVDVEAPLDDFLAEYGFDAHGEEPPE